MKEVWDQWDVETKQLFYCNYGDLPYLLSVKVDKYLFRAIAQFWNPAYCCFTFGKVDLTPTVEDYSPLEELVATPKRDDISEERWMEILQNLQDEDIEWRAPWLIPDEILYRCGDFDWVPLLGIWGVIGYAPLLVSRQYRSRQFVLATQGLAYCDFSYREDNYKKKGSISV
ncbi:hypothetical protein GOBAR_DD33987 [Gossypium barbadense]|nr:hypothetical protein GOBAR_DD33987 [Gossypium barbadense]